MSLSTVVGYLATAGDDEDGKRWFSSQLEIINGLLASHALAPHREPQTLPPLSSAQPWTEIGYSFIHRLRRVAAYRALDANYIATPFPEEQRAAEDPAIEKVGAAQESHLLCHSDCEGFYVPVDFPKVLVDERLAGGYLGSSVRLAAELRAVAPAVGIRLDAGGALSDEEAQRLYDATEDEDGLYREVTAWLDLYDAARLSVAHSSAIVFV
jgi:hypothetical protein